MRSLPLLCLGLVSCLLPACSLTGLGNFEVPECMTHDQCAPLNERDGIDPDACRLFQCQNGACILSPRDQDNDSFPPRGCADQLPECTAELRCIDCDDDDASAGDLPELCDGVDNDCDFVIDEGIGRQDGAAPLEPFVFPASGITPDNVTGTLDGQGLVRYGLHLNGAGVAVSYAGAGRAGFLAPATADAVRRPVAVGYKTSAMLGDLGFNEPGLVSGCYVPRFPTVPAPTDDIIGADPPTTCAAHTECDDGVFCNGYETCDPRQPEANAFGCVEGSNPCTGVGATCDEAQRWCRELVLGACDVADLASAEVAGSHWLAAAITTTGCASGRVMVGYFTENDASADGSDPGPDILLRGDDRRSTSFVGIDPDPNKCTGAARPAGDPRGAAAINVTGLPADAAVGSTRLRPQGLAAWLAAPLCRGAADDTERTGCAADTEERVAVEVIGVFLEEDLQMGVAIAWTNATGDGRPERLPEPTSGRGPPALATISMGDWQGYVVAYGRADGGLVVQAIGAMPDPAEVVRGEGDNPHRSPIPATAPTRTTPPIADIAAPVALPGGAGATASVDHVQITQVPLADGSGVILGLSWVEPGGVWFATLPVRTATGTPVVEVGAFMPIKLGDAADVTSIALGYAPTGFYTDDPESPGQALGGWYTMWIDRGVGAFARRVGQRDGVAIDESPRPLAIDTSLSNLGAVFVGPSDGNARPRVIAHGSGGEGNSGFVLFPGVCAPSLPGTDVPAP